MTPKVVVIDFESDKIEPRPHYPPRPCGVAIKYPGQKGQYYAWGHPTENNCTYDQGLRALKAAWNCGLDLLMHNAKFDCAVACEQMGMKMPPWHKIHDTMFLLFLDDPYSPSLALKPSAQRYLGMDPEEQDAVHNWIDVRRKELGISSQEKRLGKYICLAPGKLVAKYAVGDVLRTEKLFKLLHKQVLDRGMEEAYDTERELMPILLENEQEGMRVDLKGMSTDLVTYEAAVLRTDEWLRKKLGAPGMNINSDPQLTEALFNAGVVTEFKLTAKGFRSASKENLTLDLFNDPKVFRALAYRNKLSYSLSTFMRPWLATASATKGTIHTNWNQVMKEGAGAITGRLSSSPNFQNITKNIKEGAYVHPVFLKWAPELPSLRKYILPDRGQIYGMRDFSQQELRILADFESADLCSAYQANPDLDVHVMVQGLLADAGKMLERDLVKGFNFGILYGMGARGLSRRLGVSESEAKSLIATWNRVMPGVAQLVTDLKATAKGGDVICTWGGRQYGMPPPAMMYGDMRERDYVLLNYLIQGSGADATKRALIEFHKRKQEARIMVNVHDEIGFSAPKSAMANEQRILAKCISDLKFNDVPMTSDGKTGPTWGDAKRFVEKKK